MRIATAKIILFVLTTCVCSGIEAKTEQLSIPEVQALARAPLTTGVPWGAYARIPASARITLKAMLSAPASPQRSNAIRMLGYVGNSDDLEEVIGMFFSVETGWRPGVDKMDRASFSSVMDFLGLMARRFDARRVAEHARQMIKREPPPVEWHTVDVMKAKAELKYDPLITVVEGFSLSRNEKETKALAGELQAILERENASAIGWRLDGAKLARIPMVAKNMEDQGPRDEDRAMIKVMIETSPDAKLKEGGNVSEILGGGSADQIGIMISQTRELFSLAAVAFKRGDLSEVAINLADNQRPLIDRPVPQQIEIDKAIEQISRDAREIQREADIIADVLASGPMYCPAQVTRRQTMVATETSPGSGGYQVKMSEEMDVVIELENTQAIINKHQLRQSSPTVGPKGLRLCFMYRHGRWMWTPFGW